MSYIEARVAKPCEDSVSIGLHGRAKTPGGCPPSAQFDSRRGGRARSTSESGAQPRGRLFPAVVHRFLVHWARPSPSRPAMDTRGGGYALPVSHPTKGRFANPLLECIQNDGGDSPPPFWTVGWVPPCVHRGFARRWTPGEPGVLSPRIPPQHGGIRGSRHIKRLKPLRRLSFVVLNGF